MNPASHDSRDRRLEEVLHAYLQAVDAGQAPDRDTLLRQHPDLAAELAAFFADQDKVARLAQGMAEPAAEAATLAPGKAAVLAPGTQVRYFGDYELLEEVARGGMGVVYKARQISLNRVVALKMILAGQLASPQDVQRFRTEAEAAANLDHPHIVPIYEVGQHEGQHYFSMRLVEGGSLGRCVERFRGDPRAAAGLVAAVARAVHYAHQRGILHRDLKPANILLDAKGEPHVTDFGLARRVEGGGNLTQSGAIVGTPGYMAPEQARAEKGLSTAVDVYSLGSILYELLVGRPPFRADTPLDTILQVLEKEPVPPRRLNSTADRDLETICLKCLEKDPAGRYESAAALADELDRWLSRKPILGRRTGVRERAVKWARRRPALAALLLVSAASLLGLLTLAASLWQNAEKRAEMVQDLKTARQDLDAARQERAATVAETAAARDQARRVLYDADMQSAHAAWKADNVQGLLALLERHRPRPGGEDLRGFEWYYLWRLCHGERCSWQGHTKPGGTPLVENAPILAFSPDGKTLASASLDNVLKLWDRATGKQLRAVPLLDPIASFGFTSDGKELRVVVARKGTSKAGKAMMQRVLDVAAGKATPSLQALCDSLALRTLPLESGQPPRTGPFNPAQLPAMGIPGGRPVSLRVFLRSQISLKGQMVTPTCLALSPDRKTLAIGGLAVTLVPFQPEKTQEPVVLLWDLVAGTVRATLKGHNSMVVALAFAPDGRMLASAGFDKTIRLWDVAAGRERTALKDQAAGVTSLAFSADGRFMASGSMDGTVKLWDVPTGQIRARYVGHVSSVVAVTVTPDGRTLASSSTDGVIKLWDTAAEREQIRKPQVRNVLALNISADGQTLTTVDQGGTLHVCDLVTGRERRAARLPIRAGILQGSAIAPDGKMVALSTLDTVVLIDAATNKERHRMQKPISVNDALAFSPDGGTLAVGSGDSEKSGETLLWDVATGRRRATLRGHQHRVVSLAFSPDGKSLTSGSLDQTVNIWDLAGGKEVRTIEGLDQGVSAVAYSRDGTKLAVAAGDTLSIRDAATAKELRALRLYSHHVLSMAFSPDGTRLATAGGEDERSGRGGGVKLWDLAAGQEVLSLGGSTDVVTHVAFSPDGRRLVSAHRVGGAFGITRIGQTSGELVIWKASDRGGDGGP
jgi:WD40 repeat protein